MGEGSLSNIKTSMVSTLTFSVLKLAVGATFLEGVFPVNEFEIELFSLKDSIG